MGFEFEVMFSFWIVLVEPRRLIPEGWSLSLRLACFMFAASLENRLNW